MAQNEDIAMTSEDRTERGVNAESASKVWDVSAARCPA
jgi:hypothetical protein